MKKPYFITISIIVGILFAFSCDDNNNRTYTTLYSMTVVPENYIYILEVIYQNNEKLTKVVVGTKDPFNLYISNNQYGYTSPEDVFNSIIIFDPITSEILFSMDPIKEELWKKSTSNNADNYLLSVNLDQ